MTDNIIISSLSLDKLDSYDFDFSDSNDNDGGSNDTGSCWC